MARAQGGARDVVPTAALAIFTVQPSRSLPVREELVVRMKRRLPTWATVLLVAILGRTAASSLGPPAVGARLSPPVQTERPGATRSLHLEHSLNANPTRDVSVSWGRPTEVPAARPTQATWHVAKGSFAKGLSRLTRTRQESGSSIAARQLAPTARRTRTAARLHVRMENAVGSQATPAVGPRISVAVESA